VNLLKSGHKVDGYVDLARFYPAEMAAYCLIKSVDKQFNAVYLSNNEMSSLMTFLCLLFNKFELWYKINTLLCS